MWVRSYPLPIDQKAIQHTARERRGARARGGAAAPPARAPRPARRPRGPLEERPARLQRVRPVPRAASGVPRDRHLHRPAHAVADRRARVRRVPRAHRGARGRRQPPPRHARLDADQPQAPRRPRGGGRGLQALRRAARQRDVRRDEPRRQGGADGQRARRRLDPVGEHGRARGARRVRPVGQPVRHPGAGGLDPRGADDAPGGARRAPAGAEGDGDGARSGRLDRRAARGHQGEGRLEAARRRPVMGRRTPW